MKRRNMQEIKEATARLKKAAGMTLVEIMIVITIMASVAGVVGFFVFGAIDKANVGNAETQISNLENMVMMYYTTTTPNQLPTSLDDLTAGSMPIADEVPVDPWGHDYIYSRDGSRNFTICSRGPDGVEGTEDDICN